MHGFTAIVLVHATHKHCALWCFVVCYCTLTLVNLLGVYRYGQANSEMVNYSCKRGIITLDDLIYMGICTILILSAP